MTQSWINGDNYTFDEVCQLITRFTLNYIKTPKEQRDISNDTAEFLYHYGIKNKNWTPLSNPPTTEAPLPTGIEEVGDKIESQYDFHDSTSVVFTPIWYDKKGIFNWLRNENYSVQIAEELSQKIADSLQSSFAKGWEKAVNKHLKTGTFNYKYFQSNQPKSHEPPTGIEEQKWKASPFLESYFENIAQPKPQGQGKEDSLNKVITSKEQGDEFMKQLRDLTYKPQEHKTAEEILEKNGASDCAYKDVLNSMEEYASQFKTEQPKNLSQWIIDNADMLQKYENGKK